MIQPGFFDLQDRLHKIDKTGDPLAKINETVSWDMFRPALEKARDKGRQSTVGPKGEMCPESGKMVKERHRTQSVAEPGCKTDRIKCQKSMVFVKNFAGGCYRGSMS